MKLTSNEQSKKDSGTNLVVEGAFNLEKKKRAKIQYRALLDAAPDSLVVVDQLGKVVFVNTQAEKLFGYRREELIGKSAELLISERSRGKHGEQGSRFLAVAAERSAMAALELFGVRKDGSEFPAEIRLSPLKTREETLVCGAIRDLGERRRTEEDLRRLASIVSSSDDAIIGKTLEGIITSWNLGAERMYGYSATEAIGKSVSMLVPSGCPDEIPEILERLGRGETVEHYQTVRIRKDGKVVHVEITASPIRDAMESIVGASTIGRDITDRKRREEDQSRLAAIVESSDDAIIGGTLDGIITDWIGGAERIYGYSADQVIGKSMDLLFSLGGSSEVVELMEKIKRGQRVGKSDIRVGPQGGEINITLVHAPIRNADGQVVGVSTVARDVTEGRNMEEMFRQAQKMEAIGQLAGGVAHDFNNLLGVILGYTELLLGRQGLNDQQRKDIKQIQKAGERASLLTRGLLAFSRKQVLQPRVLNLNAVIAGTEELLQRLIGEDIELRVILDPKVGCVEADSGQLEQIVMNLAVNARDAMPAGGKLSIETSSVESDENCSAEGAPVRPGPHAMLSVADDGCGMDTRTKSRIFEPFFTTKGFGKGTGLGLATVYGIVKQCGGSIKVDSQLGIGTSFKICFPCVAPVPELSLLNDNEKISVDRAEQTILIVEDDGALLEVTHRSLKDIGYEILTAGSPAEAINIAENHRGPIHLMVTDVIMPGMSGRQLASHLSVARPLMKVLFVSGYTDDTIAHHGVLEPGVAFLQKPFSPSALGHKVSEVLATVQFTA
jgi:two-component system, cell cycle sensor histidine kinase and response regulator CckA